MTRTDTESLLLRHAADVAERSHVPYSGRPQGCVILLEDGSLVAGARVESASFSLVIPASINALSTLAAMGRRDAVAMAISREPASADRAVLESTFAGTFKESTPGIFRRSTRDNLPAPTTWLDPRVPTPSDGIADARAIAERAIVPESDFPVGCIAVTRDDISVPGVNVEHEDWARVICAERNALGTIVTYGLGEVKTLYLTCLRDPNGTPCGACRQLLAELAPEAEICMDRGDAPPLTATPSSLLPGAFAGGAIPTRSGSSSS
jgi:cytidine deaminase